jgi:hypothetical protein
MPGRIHRTVEIALSVAALAACSDKPAARPLDWSVGREIGFQPLPPGPPVGDGPVARDAAGEAASRRDGLRDALADARAADRSKPVEAGPTPCFDAVPCKGYACNLTLGVCRTSCTAPGHCATGYLCSATSSCVKAVPCKSDLECGGYACDATGLCAVSCSLTQLCASGYTCAPDGQCKK